MPSIGARRDDRDSKRRSKGRPAAPDAAGPHRCLGRFLRRRRALAQQVSAHGVGDIFEALRPEVGHLKLESRLDLPIGVLRQANPARLTDPLQPGGDVDAVAHEIAIRLLDNIAKMNPDAKLDKPLGRKAGVALDHAALHLKRAAHGVDDAAELDDRAVPGALDDAAMMRGDGGVDEVAAKPLRRARVPILIRACEPAISDDVRDKNRRKLSGLAHFGVPLAEA